MDRHIYQYPKEQVDLGGVGRFPRMLSTMLRPRTLYMTRQLYIALVYILSPFVKHMRQTE